MITTIGQWRTGQTNNVTKDVAFMTKSRSISQEGAIKALEECEYKSDGEKYIVSITDEHTAMYSSWVIEYLGEGSKNRLVVV
jgi:hypothetical protein